MSQTVLGGLRRRIDGLLRAVPPDERADATSDGPLAPDGGEREDEHLRDVPDGAGCTEIWEHLSGRGAPEAGGETDD